MTHEHPNKKMVSPQLLSHSQNDEEARLKSRLTQELVGEISLPNEDQVDITLQGCD
jgi:hypothetical protein